MKNTIIVLAAVLALVGCQKKNDVNESAGAQKDSVDQSAKSQKNALDQQKKEIEKSASATKKEISESAGAQKERVEAQADAAKANITAEQKKIEADAKAAKADADAQAKAAKASADAQTSASQPAAGQTTVNESAGAQSASGLGAQDQATSDADRAIVQQIRQSLTSADATAQPQATGASTSFKNVTIISKDGVITLKGTVQSDAEKADLEAKTKAISGVKSVDNQLQVKAQ
ncbi:MAG: osmY [Verrucomicrobiales bacterium]|nr:osmY [Verrucomicrobiales bacterium]